MAHQETAESRLSSILIIEDDPETRSGLCQHIEASDALSVAGAGGSVAEGIALLDSAQPPVDVLLVDLGLPDGTGEDVIRHARSLAQPPEIMVITVFGDEQHVVSAIEAGATGYLLKDSSRESLAQSIHDLLNGGSPITPIIARHILRRFGGARSAPAELAEAQDEDTPKLTPRESEVLSMVARGYTNNEIADLLQMSFHTVTSHIKHIYRKLSVRSRSEAIFEASQLGILDLNRD